MSAMIDAICADLQATVGKGNYYDSSKSQVDDIKRLKAGGCNVLCDGLIRAAVKAHSSTVLKTGSNYIWRNLLSEKGAISDGRPSDPYDNHANPLKSSQLQKGMVVFKWNSNTPSKYGDGLGDYQHIGMVTRVNPLRIVHSTSVNGAGPTVDTSIGAFCAWGKVVGLNYDDHQEVDCMLVYAYKLQVTASSLIIREQPTTASAKMGSLKAGAIAYAVDKTEDGWYKLANQAGYISGHYVKVLQEVNDLDETVTTPEPTPAQPDQLTAVVNHLKEVDEQLADLIERLRKLEVDLDVGE